MSLLLDWAEAGERERESGTHSVCTGKKLKMSHADDKGKAQSLQLAGFKVHNGMSILLVKYGML